MANKWQYPKSENDFGDVTLACHEGSIISCTPCDTKAITKSILTKLKFSGKLIKQNHLVTLTCTQLLVLG